MSVQMWLREEGPPKKEGGCFIFGLSLGCACACGAFRKDDEVCNNSLGILLIIKAIVAAWEGSGGAWFNTAGPWWAYRDSGIKVVGYLQPLPDSGAAVFPQGLLCAVFLAKVDVAGACGAFREDDEVYHSDGILSPFWRLVGALERSGGGIGYVCEGGIRACAGHVWQGGVEVG